MDLIWIDGLGNFLHYDSTRKKNPCGKKAVCEPSCMQLMEFCFENITGKPGIIQNDSGSR
jgi:hypothetical protein